MAKSRFSDAPIAPNKASFRQMLQLRRQGSQDAKKYPDAQDYTRTHALIQSQSRCNAGQHEVNQWFLKKVDPLIAGNLRLSADVELLEQRLRETSAGQTQSARERSRLASVREQTAAQISNLQAQREINIAQIANLQLSAEEALKSWNSYYQFLAAIYARSKTRKSQGDAPSAQASVPQFEDISLVELSLGMESQATSPRRSVESR
jgi:hypothetical protein